MSKNIKLLLMAIIAYILCDLLWIMFYDSSESLSLKEAIGMIGDPMMHKLKIILEKAAIFAVIFFAEISLIKEK